MSSSSQSFKPQPDEWFQMSSESLKRLLSSKENENHLLGQNIMWSDDFTQELPIRMQKSGPGSFEPTTLIDEFQTALKNFSQKPALSVKRDGVWHTLSFSQYYSECILFARACMAMDLKEYTAINIIGFNSPEWLIAFYGSLFCMCLPVGVYTTNTATACEYLAKHSGCQIVIAENEEYALKYSNLINQGIVKRIIVYDPKFKSGKRQLVRWDEFLREGERIESRVVEHRMSKVQPGNCCTLVYTSGTTGMPKGVMLSHDNYTWTKKSMDSILTKKVPLAKLVSYLPLSHVAAQFSDIVATLMQGIHVYFADPSALQGSLIQTLLEVRPSMLFSVPRVWEKIYEKMQEVAKNNSSLKQKIAAWAKSIGAEGTMREIRQEPTSWKFKLAKVLVYNNVKKALGLNQCALFLFGAAPLDPRIRQYFLTLNIFLINSYGMSESTGPQNFSDRELFDHTNLENYKEVGRNIPGTEIKIVKANSNDEDGEICYKGRNRFMGYYKNPQQTAKAIDGEGFLHSGDMGKLDKNGILYITGRLKELIVTAGGQNVAPILIQNQIRNYLPFVSSVMVVGDMKKYLVCMLSLKEDPGNKNLIQGVALQYLQLKGFEGKTIEEGRKSKTVNKLINEGLKKANQKAISRAQIVQNFYILPQEFSVENGLLTPTLKLKRKEALKKYSNEIEQMYQTPSL